MLAKSWLRGWRLFPQLIYLSHPSDSQPGALVPLHVYPCQGTRSPLLSTCNARALYMLRVYCSQPADSKCIDGAMLNINSTPPHASVLDRPSMSEFLTDAGGYHRLVV